MKITARRIFLNIWAVIVLSVLGILLIGNEAHVKELELISAEINVIYQEIEAEQLIITIDFYAEYYGDEPWNCLLVQAIREYQAKMLARQE